MNLDTGVAREMTCLEEGTLAPRQGSALSEVWLPYSRSSERLTFGKALREGTARRGGKRRALGSKRGRKPAPAIDVGKVLRPFDSNGSRNY
jgi:hypothetical protein